MTDITTPPRSGPWAWRQYLPEPADLDRFRIVVLLMDPPENLHVGRFLRWVASEVEGTGSPVSGPQALAKYRRFLYEVAVARGHVPPPKGRDAGAAASELHPLKSASPIIHDARGSVELVGALDELLIAA